VGSSARISSLPVLGLGLVVALLVAVPVALAAEEAEVDRKGYVERVEPICKANTEANSRILKGVKEQVKSGKLVPAGKRFTRASSALGMTVGKIAAVPQPSEDVAKLTKWIGYLKSEKTFLQKIGTALKAKDKFHAQKLAVELNKNNNRANNTVISFGFNECRIDSSRFI
jgi:type IV secretory pathway protease TraF